MNGAASDDIVAEPPRLHTDATPNHIQGMTPPAGGDALGAAPPVVLDGQDVDSVGDRVERAIHGAEAAIRRCDEQAAQHEHDAAARRGQLARWHADDVQAADTVPELAADRDLP